MRVAIIGDIHFNPFRPFATFENGENSRFTEIIAAWKWTIEDALDRGCLGALVAGDVFHTRGALRPSIFNRVFLEIESSGKRLDLLFIPGNHDMENYRGGATAIDTFNTLHGVDVALDPGIVNFKGTSCKIACIPYIHNMDEFKTLFKELARKKPAAVMVHQGVDNFANPGMPDMGLTVGWLRANFAGPVFAGHYHKPQKNGLIVSPGSLVQHGFGDSGEHGYWIWDTDCNDMTFVAVPGPEFVTITNKKDAGSTFEQYVRVTGKTIKEAEAIRKVAEKAGAKGVIIKMEKSFATAHSQSIPLGGPKEMLTEYLNLKHKKRAGSLIRLFEKICEGATA